jgi:aryl-alcohol dehydrogenase-like predicted oxidoreductase
MARGEVARIPRREISPGGLPLSLLSISVQPGPIPGGPGDDAVVHRLRTARKAGVTTFDVAGARDGPRSERLLARAFPDPDPEIVVIVGRRVEDLVRRDGADPPPHEGADGVPQRLRASLRETDRRLFPHSAAILEWTGELLSGLNAGAASEVGVRAPWLFRKLSDNDPVPPGGATTDGPLAVSGSLSLLRPEWGLRLGPVHPSRPVAFLARDPFAGGRLDGSRAAASGVDRGPRAEPPRLRDLQQEFAPVLRLAFLTHQRTRTLAQAALRYAAHWKWVTSVIVPLPTIDRMDEVLSTFTTPPLSDDDLRQVGVVAASFPAGGTPPPPVL